MGANEYIVEGKRVAPEKALASGLIDAVVDDEDSLVSAGKEWVMATKTTSGANSTLGYQGLQDPWRQHQKPTGCADGHHGRADQEKYMRSVASSEKIFDVAVQALTVDFDTAMRIESRGLAELALTPQAKNMINTFFFQMNKINGGASRPKDVLPQVTESLCWALE